MSASASPGGKRKPVSPSATCSASPPARDAATTRPIAIASQAAYPLASRQREGTATHFAPR